MLKAKAPPGWRAKDKGSSHKTKRPEPEPGASFFSLRTGRLMLYFLPSMRACMFLARSSDGGCELSIELPLLPPLSLASF